MFRGIDGALSWWKQRATCDGPTVTISGFSVRQRSSANVQRAANTHPSKCKPSDGGEPGIVSRRSVFLCKPPRGMQRSRPTVYGCCGLERISAVVPSSTRAPAYNTPTRSHMWRITPRLCEMKSTAVPVSRRSSRTKSSTSASTVASRPVVGSSITSRRGFDASAIAITTRWAIPPESWCAYRRITFSGSAIFTRTNASRASFPASDFDFPASSKTSAT